MLILKKTLARIGPIDGYCVAHGMEQMSEDVVAEEGSLDPTLERMLIKGWLVAKWKHSENNVDARKTQAARDGVSPIRAGVFGG